ncbi:MAG: tRNA pseudouridine(38-40) synthase TruA [Ignavibacteriales bacterium]|nr:MAG: tRNA pseudouridine(38-40) synthase TruA [Ignavibacteriales bacterium]
MNNYKLIIQYDGTNYCGWQIQENAVTVQQKISESIELLLSEKINLIGSGRTDSGVHAIGQCANFRCSREIDIYRFRHSLNSILPFDISIVGMEKVHEDFHARFDAVRRSYLYIITKYKSPFYLNYSYFYHDRIDVNKLNALSKSFLGEFDFTSFSRKVTDTENKVCTVYNASWRESKGLFFFYIEADRFLHGMVRTITGTLLKTLKLDLTDNYIIEIINQKNREAAGEAVPAKGLFLYKVKYK